MEDEVEFWHSYYSDGSSARKCASRDVAMSMLDNRGGYVFTRSPQPLIPYASRPIERPGA